MAALAQPVGTLDTQLVLDGPIAADYGERITLDNEALTVVAGGGTTVLTVWRAQNGTDPAAHPVGTAVVMIWYGIARWPVTIPASSALLGQNGQSITMPTNGTIVLTTPGGLVLTNLPTVDPHVVGRVWSNKGVLNVSQG